MGYRPRGLQELCQDLLPLSTPSPQVSSQPPPSSLQSGFLSSQGVPSHLMHGFFSQMLLSPREIPAWLLRLFPLCTRVKWMNEGLESPPQDPASGTLFWGRPRGDQRTPALPAAGPLGNAAPLSPQALMRWPAAAGWGRSHPYCVSFSSLLSQPLPRPAWGTSGPTPVGKQVPHLRSPWFLEG